MKIEKKNGVTPPPAPATSPTQPTGKVFQVEAPKAVQAVGAVGALSALDQLQSGAIDLDRYMDIMTEEATEHLKGLAPSELDFIKRELRFRMVHSPNLREMVEKATGKKIDDQ